MAAAAAAEPAAPVLPYRVGHGFDLHRLAEGYKLIIGGVDIPHTKGCEAHSDGGRQGGRQGIEELRQPCGRRSVERGSMQKKLYPAAATAHSMRACNPLWQATCCCTP